MSLKSYCPKCGGATAYEAAAKPKFCSKCGNSLEAKASIPFATFTTPNIPQTPVAPAPRLQRPVQNEEYEPSIDFASVSFDDTAIKTTNSREVYKFEDVVTSSKLGVEPERGAKLTKKARKAMVENVLGQMKPTTDSRTHGGEQ